MKKITVLILVISLFYQHLLTQTIVQKSGDKWQLMIDGSPFDIKGATFGYDQDIENYAKYFQELKAMGVNTIRTWATGAHSKKLLDAAQAVGIKVMMGIWMRHGRPGMEADDSFNYLEDEAGKEAMYQNALDVVRTYKDHPAVLTWGIGNEVYLNMATDAEKEAYSILLEKICSEMKQLDPHHPITSIEAWTFGMDWWSKYVPSIDIYGLNCYGAGANILPNEMEKREIDKPYIITEFGVTGEWDIKAERNGIKIEPTDQQKYETIVSGYRDWIVPKPNCLGVYVFHYANGKDFISPWLFTHHQQCTRPQYWAIRAAYTGQKPTNQVPVIESFTLPEVSFKSGAWVPVNLSVTDLEGEELKVSFFYNQRTGSRKRRDQLTQLVHRGNLKEGLEIQLPVEDGAIKVYVNVQDASHNLGIASTSILVEDEVAAARKYLVPKVKLPFYVYREGGALPYIPSGHMGNINYIKVDTDCKTEAYAGETSLKIAYQAKEDWYGVGLVDPPNDWGDNLGGFDISGAKTFSFWAKANDTNVKATIGFGLIGKDKPFPDTAKKSMDIVLTTEWKKYSMKLKKTDLTCIRSGLVLFSSSDGFAHEIYLDEVVFE